MRKERLKKVHILIDDSVHTRRDEIEEYETRLEARLDISLARRDDTLWNCVGTYVVYSCFSSEYEDINTSSQNHFIFSIIQLYQYCRGKTYTFSKAVKLVFICICWCWKETMTSSKLSKFDSVFHIFQNNF